MVFLKGGWKEGWNVGVFKSLKQISIYVAVENPGNAPFLPPYRLAIHDMHDMHHISPLMKNTHFPIRLKVMHVTHVTQIINTYPM